MNRSLLGGLWSSGTLYQRYREGLSMWPWVGVCPGGFQKYPTAWSGSGLPLAGWVTGVCTGEEPCEHGGVWSAGLGIINPGRRWGWEWTGFYPVPLRAGPLLA